MITAKTLISVRDVGVMKTIALRNLADVLLVEPRGLQSEGEEVTGAFPPSLESSWAGEKGL